MVLPRPGVSDLLDSWYRPVRELARQVLPNWLRAFVRGPLGQW